MIVVRLISSFCFLDVVAKPTPIIATGGSFLLISNHRLSRWFFAEAKKTAAR